MFFRRVCSVSNEFRALFKKSSVFKYNRLCWQYIVVAPRACDDGCECKKACSLPGDPDGFQTFYRMQLRAITWGRSLAGKAGAKYEAFREMNTTCGNGIAGHSSESN